MNRYPQFPPYGAPMHSPAPEPPPRPDSIRLAVQLWIAVIVCQTVAAISQYPAVRREAKSYAEDYLEQSGGDAGDLDSVQTMLSVGVVVMQIVLLGGLAVAAIVFAYRGRGWARLLLGWMSAFLAVLLIFDIIGLLLGADDDSVLSVPEWGMIPRILGGVAAMGALAALMNKDSARYCRETAEFRGRKTPGNGGR